MFYQREINSSPGGATSGRPYKSKDQAGMGTKGELQYTQKFCQYWQKQNLSKKITKYSQQ